MPLACELFPEWIGPEECVEQYGFTVRYKVGEDRALAEHFDTSNLTLNVCFGRSRAGLGIAASRRPQARGAAD